nr:perisilin-6 [Euplectella curvistellata]
MRAPMSFATVILALIIIPYGEGQLTQGERDEILDLHNNYRRWVQPAATNMEIMQWSDCLEQVAFDYLSTCPGFAHNNGRSTDAQALGCEESSYVGENLYWSSDSLSNISKSVEAWYEEYAYYDINTMSCSYVCGHYTQIVWATSYLVGCSKFDASANCGSDTGTYFICNYAPGGNTYGVEPYATGSQCSQCREGSDFCVNGLCSETSAAGSITSLCANLICLMLLVVTLLS